MCSWSRTIILQRGDERVSVSWYGDVITGGDREPVLLIPVDTLEAIAQDTGARPHHLAAGRGTRGRTWTAGTVANQISTRTTGSRRPTSSFAWSYWLTRGGYAGLQRPATVAAEGGVRAGCGRRAVQSESERRSAWTRRPRSTWSRVARDAPLDGGADVCETPRFAAHWAGQDAARKGEESPRLGAGGEGRAG